MSKFALNDVDIRDKLRRYKRTGRSVSDVFFAEKSMEQQKYAEEKKKGLLGSINKASATVSSSTYRVDPRLKNKFE